MKSEKPHFDVAAGIIWRNGKILISRRPAGSHLEGIWEFPGGKLEDQETLVECLEREVDEELGVRVVNIRHLICVRHEYPKKKISLHFFSCEWGGGEPAPLEGQEIKWIDPADLALHRFPPPDAKAIKLIRMNGKCLGYPRQ